MREDCYGNEEKRKKKYEQGFLTKSMAWRFVCDMTNLDLIAFYCLLLPATPDASKYNVVTFIKPTPS